MRIAMVGPFGFHPNKTMRSRAFQLAKPLVMRGHEVMMIMPPWQTPGDADQVWTEDGVEIRYISLQGGIVRRTKRLVRQTLAWHPDIVHTFKPKAYSGLVAWWLWHFKRGRIGLVTDADDWEGWGGWNEKAPYTYLQKRFFSWQEQWGIGHNHGLTVASRTLQSLAWANGKPPQQVFYLPNGPGIGDATGKNGQIRAELGLAGRPVLLLYSRLFEFDTARLFSILQLVQVTLPDLAILGVGSGLHQDEAIEFRQLLEDSSLSQAFVDVGWLDETELPGYLASADVGLYLMEDTLLNRAKCPVKLADMLSVGIPVVAEAVGQVPEYVKHRQSGLLRESGDNEGLAMDLVDLLQNSELRTRLAAGARAHIKSNFAWSRLAETVEKVYEECLID
jgi:glycosyltransferase involved in cell wall biosynthesis